MAEAGRVSKEFITELHYTAVVRRERRQIGRMCTRPGVLETQRRKLLEMPRTQDETQSEKETEEGLKWHLKFRFESGPHQKGG